MYGNDVQDGWGGGNTVERRVGLGNASFGDGGGGKRYGDVRGHSGDDHERPDGDHHGEAERKHADRRDFTGDGDSGERADMQPDQPGVRGECDVHGDSVEDWRSDGDAVEQRNGADGAGFGDGWGWQFDGDVHRRGGDDRKRSDGDRHGHAERWHLDGNHRIGNCGSGERIDMQPDKLGVRGECNLHGDGVEGGWGDGGAVEQRNSADGAGFGYGEFREHDGDVYGRGGDDHERSDGDRYGDAERKYPDQYNSAGDGDGRERAGMQPDKLGIGRECDVYSDSIEYGWDNGDSVEQRGGADGAGFGDGRVREYDGDVYGRGGDDHGRSDRDPYGQVERWCGDGNDRPGSCGRAERVDMQPHQPGIGRKCDVHGDRVEDGWGDRDAVEQHRGLDGAGFSDGGGGEHNSDVRSHGGDDHKRSVGNHHGDAERK